ncbi:DivIVA domain-containing protein [Mesomycoplasma neurolyticum]|nr:DivIVA domain-containing protein [Mesomycoplasma neurolyticum]
MENKEKKYAKYFEEILEKKFDVVINGYDPEQVDLFFDHVSEWLEDALQELTNQNKKLKELYELKHHNSLEIKALKTENEKLKDFLNKIDYKKENI